MTPTAALHMERNHDDDIAYFIAFCIELYKNSHLMSGGEVSKHFSKYDVPKYLAENFDVLHTQSPAWILEEIDDYIKQSPK